jgi:hypothetical protein
MSIPALIYVVSAAQGLPVIAVAFVGGRQPLVSHKRLAIMGSVLVFGDALSVLATALFHYNLWIQWFMMPLEMLMTLWILASWHSPRFRRVYATVGIMVSVLVGLFLTLPDRSRIFEQWLAPVIALMALVATVHTLVLLSVESFAPLTRQDWFWVCIGLALFWLMYVPIAPFADALVGSNTDWVMTAYIARAWVCLFSFLLMSWGVLCPRVLTRSS